MFFHRALQQSKAKGRNWKSRKKEKVRFIIPPTPPAEMCVSGRFNNFSYAFFFFFWSMHKQTTLLNATITKHENSRQVWTFSSHSHNSATETFSLSWSLRRKNYASRFWKSPTAEHETHSTALG